MVNQVIREQSISRADNQTQFHLAKHYHEHIDKEIRKFAESISKPNQLGVTVNLDNDSETFYLKSMEHIDPDLVIFKGIDEAGVHIECMQHTNKISFVLKELKPAQEVPFCEETSAAI